MKKRFEKYLNHLEGQRNARMRNIRKLLIELEKVTQRFVDITIN